MLGLLATVCSLVWLSQLRGQLLPVQMVVATMVLVVMPVPVMKMPVAVAMTNVWRCSVCCSLCDVHAHHSAESMSLSQENPMLNEARRPVRRPQLRERSHQSTHGEPLPPAPAPAPAWELACAVPPLSWPAVPASCVAALSGTVVATTAA